ncbi:MAG TPA: translation initiation factor IF-2 N-terminal domain-containing protein, partial [Pirellulales bacterium]|nr:translation initiation factor IF-2 N-terminal domain-containing protein [Pirellulales bacterium]
MAKATKKSGIRVNALAHELEVESKDILAKLRDEGLDWAPNHQSTITLGQAETIREWVASGEIAKSAGGVAVETAPGEDAPAKPKSSRSRKKKEEPAPTESAESEAAPVAPPAEEAPVAAPPEPVVEAPLPVEPAPPAPEVEAPKPVAPPHPPATVRPAATIPPPVEAPRPSRPTITLANRTQSTAPVRKPVIPAPQLTTLSKPVMQGPKVVRVEKPDIVPPLRGKPRPGPSQDQPSVTQARPATGRGVRVVDDEDEEGKKKSAKGGGRTLSARRRGPDGRRGEAMEKLKEYTEADLIELRDRINAASASRASFEGHLKKSSERGTHQIARSTIERGEPVKIEEPITVKSLSAALGVKANDVIGKLMKQGVFANINQGLDIDTATMIALDYGLELKITQKETLEQQLQAEFENRQVEPEKLQSRPPVVTILGHVDHGKTSLLDKIRNANVAAGEAGGITQHTAAWMVTVGEGDARKRVTFIDTPGHQAFTSMRARGANMTDVVVLVVSAAEGVQPQTIESINHARAAGVPIVVAMNKIDRPDTNEQKVLGEL